MIDIIALFEKGEQGEFEPKTSMQSHNTKNTLSPNIFASNSSFKPSCTSLSREDSKAYFHNFKNLISPVTVKGDIVSPFEKLSNQATDREEQKEIINKVIVKIHNIKATQKILTVISNTYDKYRATTKHTKTKIDTEK